MKGRLGFFIVVLAVALGGCAIKLVDVETAIPDMEMKEKFPLRAAVLIREPSLALKKIAIIPRDCNINPKSFAPYRFGNIFKSASHGVFSQMFTELEVIHQMSVSKEYDIIMEANLHGISNKPGCGIGIGQKGFFQAKGSLRILDPDLNEVWSSSETFAADNFEVGVTVFDSGHVNSILSESISRSIVSLVQQWGRELKSSFALYKYAKAVQNRQQSAANPPQSGSAAVTSDVDEIPTRKGSDEKKNAYAIVIGVEQYRQELPHAEFAARDAQIVTQYLTKTLGYPEQNVITLLNEHAAKSDFEKYFEKWLPNNVEKDASVFVYYSGHGAPNSKSKDTYLVPYDGDPSFIEETGYSLKRMYDSLGKLPAKEIVVALDACFSGAGGRSVIAKGARPLVLNLHNMSPRSKNMIVLAAASGDQISSSYNEKGHGLFTYFFLKGIKNEDVVKQDGSLEIKDLYGYIKPQVESIARKKYNNEQTPQLIESKKN